MNHLLSARFKLWSRRWGWLAPVVALSAGCGREQVKVYYVPKEGDAPAPTSMATAAADQPQLQWTTPAGWQEMPSEGGTFNFTIGGAGSNQAQFSVKAFPSMGMSQLDMVNISRESSGMPALDQAGFEKLAEKVDVGSDKGNLLDFKGPVGEVMVTILDRNGVTWFFKMLGGTDVVSAQKPAMLAFLKSVSFAAGGHQIAQGMHFGANSSRVPSDLPMSTPPPAMPASAPDLGSASSGKPAWTLPADWHEVAPGDMILARLAIGAEGQGEVTVSSFPGEVGGLLANVNRWRGQMKQPPVSQEDLTKTVSTVKVNGGEASLVEVTGQDAKTGKDARLLGLIWPHGGQTWFFKLTADPAVAAKQKDAFVKFVQSVRFPNG